MTGRTQFNPSVSPGRAIIGGTIGTQPIRSVQMSPLGLRSEYRPPPPVNGHALAHALANNVNIVQNQRNNTNVTPQIVQRHTRSTNDLVRKPTLDLPRFRSPAQTRGRAFHQEIGPCFKASAGTLSSNPRNVTPMAIKTRGFSPLLQTPTIVSRDLNGSISNDLLTTPSLMSREVENKKQQSIQQTNQIISQQATVGRKASPENNIIQRGVYNSPNQIFRAPVKRLETGPSPRQFRRNPPNQLKVIPNPTMTQLSQPPSSGRKIMTSSDTNQTQSKEYEHQMGVMRSSLLSHIADVQKEICRLQTERKKVRDNASQFTHPQWNADLRNIDCRAQRATPSTLSRSSTARNERPDGSCDPSVADMRDTSLPVAGDQYRSDSARNLGVNAHGIQPQPFITSARVSFDIARNIPSLSSNASNRDDSNSRNTLGAAVKSLTVPPMAGSHLLLANSNFKSFTNHSGSLPPSTDDRSTQGGGSQYGGRSHHSLERDNGQGLDRRNTVPPVNNLQVNGNLLNLNQQSYFIPPRSSPVLTHRMLQPNPNVPSYSSLQQRTTSDLASVANTAAVSSLCRSLTQTVTSVPSSPVRQKQFIPYNCMAYKIQRAYRLWMWRSRFTSYGEKLGWVGTLDWLQKHNFLYGTELAEPCDVSTWEMARKSAPLDSEVDPWGSAKLKDHLHRMWFGEPPPPPPPPPQVEKRCHSETRKVLQHSYAQFQPQPRREKSIGPIGLQIPIPSWRRSPSLGARELSDTGSQQQIPQAQPGAFNLHRSPELTLREQPQPPATSIGSNIPTLQTNFNVNTNVKQSNNQERDSASSTRNNSIQRGNINPSPFLHSRLANLNNQRLSITSSHSNYQNLSWASTYQLQSGKDMLTIGKCAY